MKTLQQLETEIRNARLHPNVIPTLEKIQEILIEAMEENHGCDHTGVQGHGTCSCPLNFLAMDVCEALARARSRREAA